MCSYVSEVNKSEKGRLYYNLGGGLIKGGKEVVDFDKYEARKLNKNTD